MENKDLSEQMTEILSGLTDEQKEKISRCKTPEELTARLGEWGIELPDEALDGGRGQVRLSPLSWNVLRFIPARQGVSG